MHWRRWMMTRWSSVNSLWRKLENQLRKLKERISTTRNRMAKLGKDESKQRANISQKIRLPEAEHENLGLEKTVLTGTFARHSPKTLSVLTCCLSHIGFSLTSCVWPPIRPIHAWSWPWQVRRAKNPIRAKCCRHCSKPMPASFPIAPKA